VVRTIIQLDDEQHRELTALIREGVDRIIRDAVAPEDRKRRALEVAGKYRSGIRDLAEKHDAYLAEDYGEETR